ncbi:MAG: LCP family protein [Actinomycetota bacterium]|nr:LCP family protein [Actinomycetota bacterium]
MRRLLAWASLFSTLMVWVAAAALMADPPPATAQGTPVPVGHPIGASSLPSFPFDDPFYVLTIGSDARPGVCEPVERCLADSIHLIGVNPKERAASIIGIPRDSYVSIPGHGQAKINDSLFLGGPELVVQTVEELADVDIEMYFLTSFEGFRHMVEEIGGIEVEIPYAMSDTASGAVFEEGNRRLTGREALAFSRNRKDTPNGDFSRTENQGLIMLGALRQFQAEVRRDPLRMLEWLVLGARYIQTDVTLSDLFQLALASLRLDQETITNVAMPGGISNVGGASVVTVGGEATAVFQDIADDGLIEAPPTEESTEDE